MPDRNKEEAMLLDFWDLESLTTVSLFVRAGIEAGAIVVEGVVADDWRIEEDPDCDCDCAC